MIYLDNAATSFPKPPMVVRAMAGTLQKLGGNPGRSGHALSLCGGRIIQRCRELLAEAFDAPAPENVIFFPSCTEALNTAIRGTLCEGDEVICSHAEHNAVMRVLKGLEEQGAIRVRMLAPNSLGLIAPEALTAAITPRTALCVICHASNVTGVVQPVQQLSRALKPYGVPLLVDAAQTAGILDVSLSSLGADMIAMPGHKGLLGPHGTGVLVLGRGMLPRPLVVGGTGSQSESMIQPEQLPDRYESGTANLGDCGPAGWSALRAVSPGGNRAVRGFTGARPAHAPVRPARRARAGPPRRAQGGRCQLCAHRHGPRRAVRRAGPRRLRPARRAALCSLRAPVAGHAAHGRLPRQRGHLQHRNRCGGAGRSRRAASGP